MTATVAFVKTQPGPGEVAANAAEVMLHVQRASQLGATVTVFPELMLTGLPPASPGAGDSLRRQANQAVSLLARTLDQEGLGGRHVVVGTTTTGPYDQPVGAAVVLHKGKTALTVTSQTASPDAVFAAHGHHFGIALDSAGSWPPADTAAPDGTDAPDGGPALADAILVLADGFAYAASRGGARISPAPAGHEGITLWTIGA
ncbi:MAG: hypothetical protein LBJ02_12580 [Bifidobacteriaceae bacterium]|nr:hypothetical protein [Bifidobacteriaceae bacterium]